MADSPTQRGEDRLMYHADGGLNVHNLWEPFDEAQLTAHIDDFADNGVDTRERDNDTTARASASYQHGARPRHHHARRT